MPKLTNAVIEQANTEGREVILWDTSMPGFGIRIKPTGVKTFVVQYRNATGRSRRLTVGRYGKLTLQEARVEARQLLADAERGRDPTQDAQEKRRAMTFRMLSERYMQDHCAGRCKPSTLAAHEWLLAKFLLPKFGSWSIHEIKRRDVEALHLSMRETPYNANRALGLIRAIFGKAEEWNIIPRGNNPGTGIKKFREKSRQRFLSMEELLALSAALDYAEETREISEQIAAAYRLLILTGARLDEIRTLRWSDVDWEHNCLRLEAHKSDRHGTKSIPLSKAALGVLRAVPRVENNPYVITGKKPGRPAVNLQKPWQRIRKRVGLEDVRIHDFRHSFASFAVGQGLSLPIIGALLGHRSIQTTAKYAHLAQQPLRDATELIASGIGHAFGRES